MPMTLVTHTVHHQHPSLGDRHHADLIDLSKLDPAIGADRTGELFAQYLTRCCKPGTQVTVHSMVDQ